MNYEGFRQKTPEELKRQDEVLQLTEIMTDAEWDNQPREYAERMRALRRHARLEDDEAELARLHEMADERIAASIENLVHNGEYIAEGNYGIVYQVDMKILPEPQRRLLSYKGVDVEGAGEDAAAKILKIAHPGMAQDEYSRLQRAYDIVAQAEHDADKPYARVPKPIGFLSGVKTSEITRSVLSAQSRKSKFDTPTSEMLFMERIEGKDLASALYEFVLLRTGMTPNVIEHMSFQDKMMEVGGRLHFSLPGGKSWDEGARQFEERVILTENANKLLAFLRKHRTDPDLPVTVERLHAIETTLGVFKENGFGHNDIHERNIMFSDDGQVYLIDYGRLDSDAMSDDIMVRRYQALLKEERSSEEIARDEVASLRGKIPDSKKAIRRAEAVLAILSDPRDDHTVSQIFLQYLNAVRLPIRHVAALLSDMQHMVPEDTRDAIGRRLEVLLTEIARDPSVGLPEKKEIRELFHISPRYSATKKSKAHPKADAPVRRPSHRKERTKS